MADSLLIVAIIVAELALSISIGYYFGRASKRGGIALAITGSILGLVLIVNYFQEVSVILFGISVAAIVLSLFLALFDSFRKEGA